SFCIDGSGQNCTWIPEDPAEPSVGTCVNGDAAGGINDLAQCTAPPPDPCAENTDCEVCVNLPNCGYCHRGQVGCKSDKPTDCEVWVAGSCSFPCAGRDSCSFCIDGNYRNGESCTWSPEDLACVNGAVEGGIKDIAQCSETSPAT